MQVVVSEILVSLRNELQQPLILPLDYGKARDTVMHMSFISHIYHIYRTYIYGCNRLLIHVQLKGFAGGSTSICAQTGFSLHRPGFHQLLASRWQLAPLDDSLKSQYTCDTKSPLSNQFWLEKPSCPTSDWKQQNYDQN